MPYESLYNLSFCQSDKPFSMWVCNKCNIVRIASSNPLEAWLANCRGGTRCSACDTMYLLTKCSDQFRTSDVTSIGWKLLGSLGLGIFGMCTTVDIFHKAWTL